jgi:hypothetical protein
MSSASRDNVPLMDNVMTPENDMGKENDFSSSNDAAADTPDNSSWTSPMTSLFSPGNNTDANTESANTDNDSWMPSLNSGADADANTDADADNGSWTSPMTSMFSSKDSASPSDAVPFDSSDSGAPMMDATPKESYFSNVVSGMQWGFDWVSIVKYVVILILLALMGLNVFSYLGDASDGAATLLERISNLFSGITADLGKGIKVVVRQTTKTTADGTKAAVDMAAGGTKGVVNVTAGAIDSGVNVLEQQLEKNGRTAADSRASASANTSDPTPDMVGNVTQSGGTGTGKSGYCYIGEDRGFRSCVKVGQMDQCMSGDIFPTEAICINPNLRE